MTNLNSFEDYFDEIQKIWGRMNGEGRIIPFCTPLIFNPKFLVIGTNHADNFDPNNETENNRIADSFANALPQEHTFLEHNHPFAGALRNVIFEVQQKYPDFKLSEEWIGTNRCAIQQTDSGGLDSIRKHGQFKSCQVEMDQLLKKFIAFVKPKNVILTGRFACEVIYPEKQNISDMKSRKVLYGKDTEGTYNVIAISSVSGSRRGPRPMVNKIISAIEEGFCDF